MKPENWKTIAIIFIVLFIVEMIGFMLVMKTGTEMVIKEEECGRICYDKGLAYYYDVYTEICSCVNEDYEVVEEIPI